jgi:AbrB family looped-hinge helix DNA binding protein
MPDSTGTPRRVVIRSRGRVTIPADLLAAAGLKPGDVVKVENRGPGRIALVPKRQPSDPS